MPTGLITVLSNVPWSDVIRHAPQVAEGARKLWDRARGKPAAPVTPEVEAPPAVTPEQQALAALEAHTAALQAAVADLQSQMTESARLIQELADLNQQLIRRVEVQGRGLRWLGVALGALALLAGSALALVLTR